MVAVTAPGYLALALFTGITAFRHLPFLRSMALPPALLGGALLLALGPQAADVPPRTCYAAWANWPKILIAFLFAGIILGEPRRAGAGSVALPVVAQTLFVWFMAVSQIALGFTFVYFSPSFLELPPLSAHIIEIGWAGIPGAAAAFLTVADRLGSRAAGELGVFSATAGLVLGAVAGLVIVNMLRRRLRPERRSAGAADFEDAAATARGIRLPDGMQMRALAVLCIAVLMAYGLGVLTEHLARLLKSDWSDLAAKIPLFAWSLVVAVPLRSIALRAPASEEFAAAVSEFAGISLDALICAAVATIQIAVFAQWIMPFSLMMLVALAWCVVLFLVFTPLFLPREHAEELGILNFGMSTGITALGLLLVRSLRGDITPAVARIYGASAPFSAPLIGGGAISLLLPELTARGHAEFILVGTLVASVLLVVVGRAVAKRAAATRNA